MLSSFPNIAAAGPANDWTGRVQSLLIQNGKEKTFTHMQSVDVAINSIAERYGLDPYVCRQSAYLHDIAAIIAPGDMLEQARRSGWTLDEAEKRYPFLLHQRFSARIAEEDFYITDRRVLSAIECHSTLKTQPSAYDMALFLADKLAWDQDGRPPYYTEVEQALAQSLEEAALTFMEYIVAHQMILYPHTWFTEARRFLRIAAMERRINPEIKDYVQRIILPEYAAFDKAHGVEHAEKVIGNSFDIAADFDADPDKVYVIAAYHDLGLREGRSCHATVSKALMLADANLSRWFSADEIRLMADAAEDHRASNDYEPRSLYGKIVAEADRDIAYHTILTRVIQYGLANNPDYTYEQHFERAYTHINEKYGEGGYLKLWLNTETNRRNLQRLREAIADKNGLERDFKAIYERL